jgi:hypothetical protein
MLRSSIQKSRAVLPVFTSEWAVVLAMMRAMRKRREWDGKKDTKRDKNSRA